MILVDRNMKAMLTQIDDWAAAEINTREHPPWAWYNLMMLRDAIQRVRNDADGKMIIPVAPSLSRADNEGK